MSRNLIRWCLLLGMMVLGVAAARADRVEVRRMHLEFSGLARSCAGGVAVDGVHDFTLTGTFYDESNVPLSGAALKFVFEGNKGHDYGDSRPLKRAKYVPNSAQAQVAVPGSNSEVMTATTDAEGKVSVQVLSSDIICNDIKIKAKWTNAQGQEKVVGSKACDFAAPQSIRRFPNQYDPDEIFPAEDFGWLFDFPRLGAPGSTTPAKVYVKFMIDPNMGDVNGNWKVVNGHLLRLYIEEVEMQDGAPAFSGNLKDYAWIVDPSNSQSTTRVVVTANDGAAQAMVKAGPKIGDVQKVFVAVEDQSVWEE